MLLGLQRLLVSYSSMRYVAFDGHSVLASR